MDLSNLDVVSGANKGTNISITHPGTGEDLGIRIHVLGRDSDVFKKLSDQQNKKRIGRMHRGGIFRPQPVPASEIEKDALELLVACTLAWHTEAKVDKEGAELEPRKDSITWKGQEYTCSPENVKLLYVALPWMKEQVDLEVNDRANFISG